jgi:hypothetical protein
MTLQDADPKQSPTKQNNDKGVQMAVTHRSKRFNPTVVTEKFVPIVLVILILILISVFVVIGLSLAGVTQPA